MTHLKNIVRFIAVAGGATATLPHGLNQDGRGGLVPDETKLNNSSFSVVSADATDVTIINNGAAPGNCDVLLEYWRTPNRVFGSTNPVPGTDPNGNLVPNPFNVATGGGGGGGSGSGFVPMGGPQLAGAPAGFASARGIYVNPQASDAADDANLSTPFLTIQGAISAVPAPTSALEELQRNTIYIAPGSYDENLTVPPARRIALLGLGAVTLGDGALTNGGSTTPRSITWQLDQNLEFGNARPQLVIGTLWHGSESSSPTPSGDPGGMPSQR